MERDKRRPFVSMWKPEYLHVAYTLALLGATEQQMADSFGINRLTLLQWKKLRPEFNEAVNKGKLEADMKVAESFYQNCHDRYVYEEEAKVVGGEVQIVQVKKFIKGDKWAQSRWLQLRQRQLGWSETQKIEIMNTNTNVNINLKEVSFEELKLLESIGYKQLPEHGGNN